MHPSDRTKQLESLIRFFPQLREDHPGAVYSVPLPISTPNSRLRILLNEHFPYTPPRLQVVPGKFSHRLLDGNGYVLPSAHPFLQRWLPGQSLGDLVVALINEFRNNEPRPAAQVAPDGPVRARDRVQIPAPDIPTSFPLVQSLPMEQVHELLNNEQKLHEFMLNIDTVANYVALFVDNTEAKDKNAALLTELGQLQVEIQNQQQNLEQHRNTYNQKEIQRQQISQRYSPLALVTVLEDKAHRLEEILDEQAESFVAHGTFNTTSVTPTSTNMSQSSSAMSMSTGPDHQFFLDNFFKNWRNDRSQFRVYQHKAELLKDLNKRRTQPQFQTSLSNPQPLRPQQPPPIQTRTGGGSAATTPTGGGGSFLNSIFGTWKPT